MNTKKGYKLAYNEGAEFDKYGHSARQDVRIARGYYKTLVDIYPLTPTEIALTIQAFERGKIKLCDSARTECKRILKALYPDDYTDMAAIIALERMWD